MSNTVLLIHGAWLNSRSWDAVKARYEARGFTVVAPDWPYDDRSPEELRDDARREARQPRHRRDPRPLSTASSANARRNRS